MAAETPKQEMDAARRCSDAVREHLARHGVDAAGKWIAVKLADGSTDGVLYDLKADAVKHQLHETLCAYVRITPDGMPVPAALSFLRTNRLLYANGARLSDPDRTVFVPSPRKEYNL